MKNIYFTALLGWAEWTVWSLCDENNEQHRQRKCRTSNPGPHLCQGSNKEARMCISDISNGMLFFVLLFKYVIDYVLIMRSKTK